MISLLLVADSGTTMQALTTRLGSVVGVEIAAYASGAAPIAAIVAATRPDVILVDEMPHTPRALMRIAEATAAFPTVKVVGMTERVEGGWAPDALRAGACAVVPRDIAPGGLALVLAEVAADRGAGPAPVIERGAA